MIPHPYAPPGHPTLHSPPAERMPAPGSCARPMRRLAIAGAAVIVAWCAALAGWATWAPIAGGVIAPGLVKVEADRRTVTHRDGGTVARIHVTEGQHVDAGALLVELADVRTDAAAAMARTQWAADRVRLARLEAEAEGRRAFRIPAALAGELTDVPGLAAQAAKEEAAFAARLAQLDGQIDGERRQMVGTRAEIEARSAERDNARKAIALMQEELAVNEKLQEQNYVGRTRVLALQRAVSEYESRRLGNDAELAQAQQRLAAAEARIAALRRALVQAAAEESREVAARVSDAEQRLRAASEDRDRQRIVAPVAGRLVGLRVNTPGSALGPREPVVDIVPDDAPLEVEVRLSVEAAADVAPGMPAELRLLTASLQHAPLLPGTVRRVGADAQFDDRTGAAYRIAVVTVDRGSRAARGVPWRAGLAAEVYLKVAERTALEFLLEPVTDRFRRAFRDR